MPRETVGVTPSAVHPVPEVDNEFLMLVFLSCAQELANEELASLAAWYFNWFKGTLFFPLWPWDILAVFTVVLLTADPW